MIDRIVLRLECVDDDAAQAARIMRKTGNTARVGQRSVRRVMAMDRASAARPWVARVVGWAVNGSPLREFIKGLKDYSAANSVGSRGVYMFFILTPGHLYEINDMRKNDRWNFLF
jgi:hypothetical protein